MVSRRRIRLRDPRPYRVWPREEWPAGPKPLSLAIRSSFPTGTISLGDDAALLRLAGIVQAPDIKSELHTDPPPAPASSPSGLAASTSKPTITCSSSGASFVYDALYAWCARQVAAVTA